jgi:hypothetical protein
MFGSEGLTRVRTEHLVELLRQVHRGTLPCPFERTDLATAGFLGLADELEHLRGLERRGLQRLRGPSPS